MKTYQFSIIIIGSILFLLLSGCIENLPQNNNTITTIASKKVPILIYPKENASIPKDNIQFDWSTVEKATQYELICFNSTTNKILARINTLKTSDYKIIKKISLKDSEYKDWIWTVRAKTNNKWRDWAKYQTFHISKGFF